MSEHAPKEQLTIPDLPPATGDFNSYVVDVEQGISDSELDARLRASRGLARDRNGNNVYKSRNGQIFQRFDYIEEPALPETRSLDAKQQEVVRKIVTAKRELAVTEEGLQDTASYLSDILAGKLSDGAELDARLRASRGLARDRNGNNVYKSRNGQIFQRFDYIEEPALPETRSLDAKQQEVVRKIVTAKRELAVTEEGLQDTASYLSDILAGKLSDGAELDARLRASRGLARDRNGNNVYKSRNGQIFQRFDYIEEPALPETRSLDAKQQEVVRYIADSCIVRDSKIKDAQLTTLARDTVRSTLSSQAIAEKSKQLGLSPAAEADLIALSSYAGTIPDKAVDAAVEALFVNGDDDLLLQTLNEQRAKYADISDTTVIRADITALEGYVQTARRLSIRGEFWRQASDPNAALQALESYEVIDDIDKTLIDELRSEANIIRRDSMIAAAYKGISGQQPNFNVAAMALMTAENAVIELKDARGFKVLNTLANSIFNSEITTVFGGLLDQLTIDGEQVRSVVAQLETARIRPNVAGVDYFEKFTVARKKFTAITDRLEAFAFKREIFELRKQFGKNDDVQTLVQNIIDLPGETTEDSLLRQTLLDELAFVVTARRGLEPGRFALLKAVEVDGIRANRPKQQEQLDLTEVNRETIIAATTNLVRRFQTSIMPLFESLRGGTSGDAMVDKYVSGVTGNREAYVQRIKSLEEQRDLTDIERAYLESVQLLTVFNPHLIALVREEPELTSLYLEKYFASLDQFTKESLSVDAYVPTLQIGLGPNGLASAGELSRVNPDVAAQTLFVDGAELPGGPFAVAKGQGWGLNSANGLGQSTNILPDVLPIDESGISVRSYGSPLVAFPGERQDGESIRQASINATVDYLPNPDNVSNKRYPTNLDLARILQLQSAMLVDHIMLSTRVTRVESVDDGQPGNKRVTMQYETPAGETVITTVRTDSIIVSSGLGTPNYGIELTGSRAEKLLLQSQETTDNFPRFTDTIGAFAALSNPEGEPAAPEGVIVIYGGGNSADVLIEYLGRQFESGNPNLNGIRKVYVLTTAPPSKRPRYNQITDLKPRNGQSNFLEVISAKVTDVGEAEGGRMELFGSDGQPLKVGKNGGTTTLLADHVIAASGFRPMLDEVFKDLLSDEESLNRRQKLGKVTLPSNPGFSIADELLKDPDVVIVGTGSRSDFENPNKLGQLPDLARNALVRNDVENAVAIGFRTPDTRAAVRLKFSKKSFASATDLPTYNREKLVDATASRSVGNAFVPLVDRAELPPTRRNVDADSDTLSALFLESLPNLRLGNNGEPLSPTDTRASQNYTFSVTYDESQAEFKIAAPLMASTGLSEALADAVANPYFQAYALKALKGRRINRGIEVSLAFSRGRLQYRDPGDVEGKGRTYVEVL